MDVFRLSAEMRALQFNAIKTTKDIMVCKVKDLPEPKDSKPSLITKKHLESGLCVMFHTTDGCVMEVRGYDEEGKEFSYKFHYEKSPKQPVTMRAVGASGNVSKLNVSVDTSDKQKSGVNIIQK